MIIGILQLEVAIDGVESLKDKRRVVVSLKDRLTRRFKVSVAEVDLQDSHGTAVLGVALAASEIRVAQSVLDRILEFMRQERDCVLTDHQLEILTGR